MFVLHRDEKKNDSQHDVCDVPICQIVSTFEHVLTRIKGKLNKWEWKCKSKIGQYPRRIIKIVRQILTILSGGDVTALLNMVLTEYEMMMIY